MRTRRTLTDCVIDNNGAMPRSARFMTAECLHWLPNAESIHGLCVSNNTELFITIRANGWYCYNFDTCRFLLAASVVLEKGGRRVGIALKQTTLAKLEESIFPTQTPAVTHRLHVLTTQHWLNFDAYNNRILSLQLLRHQIWPCVRVWCRTHMNKLYGCNE